MRLRGEGLRKRRMRVRRRSAHSQETVAAINRASLCRSKRHSGFDGAQGATHHHFDAFARERLSEARHVRSNALVLFTLAAFAALRIIFQSLVSEKELLTRCK